MQGCHYFSFQVCSLLLSALDLLINKSGSGHDKEGLDRFDRERITGLILAKLKRTGSEIWAIGIWLQKMGWICSE